MPDYSRIAHHLPAVYKEQQESFAQVDTFLEMIDAEARAIVDHLSNLPSLHGPDAALAWPAHVPLDAGLDAVLDAMLATYDEVAAWFAYEYPRTWGRDEPGVARRREFTSRASNIWRRRSTPRGFIDWFMLAFDITATDRPHLIEHFMFPEYPAKNRELTGTLFVRATAAFDDYRRRQEAISFVDENAPAHVLLRVCWMPPELTFPDVGEYESRDLYRSAVSSLLCSMISHVGENLGFTLATCPPDTASSERDNVSDRLDIGLLPSDREDPES